MHQVLVDARFALRLLRRSPAFGATLLGVLIAGIGATTAMFSIVLSLLLRPLPYPHPEELTMVWATQRSADRQSPVSLPDFLDWRAQATTFSKMTAVASDAYSLSSEGDKPEPLPGAKVSGDFFPMLGVAPLRGRLLGPDDDRVGGPRVAVISAAVWHRRYGSDPALVGRTVRLNGESFVIVGIAPEGFRFSGPNSNRCDVWTPLAVTQHDYARQLTQGRDSHFLNVMGRRRPGVSLEAAGAELGAIAKSLATTYPESNTNVGVRLLDLHDQLVGPSRQGVWVLFAAVGLVFLVVCANVANLLLARAAARRPEMAARAALGATRGRLAAQLVTETAVVFLIAAGGGAVLAWWLVDLFAAGVVRANGAATIDIRVDGAALGFAIVTSLICGLVFGLVPAAEAARVDPQTVLKESAARASMGPVQRIIRGGLVVAQVALAFALLAGSGLALRAFARTASTPPGFDADHLAKVMIILPATKYADDDKAYAFFRDVLERIAAEPGVDAVAANSTLPMSGSNWTASFQIEGRPPWPAGSRPDLECNSITPGYFRAMGIPILRGREFTPADTKNARLVMIISQSTAERFFFGEDPIGKRIDWGEEDKEGKHVWREIVGVTGDVRRWGLDQPVAAESYAPLAQSSRRFATIVARSRRAEALLQDIPPIVATVDPEQAVTNRQLMTDTVAGWIGPQRFVTIVLAAFAMASLLLATLGMFGLVSYTTSQRTRELGIRMALGASPEGVIAVVMREGVGLLAVGLVLGIGGALLIGQAMALRVSGAASFDVVVLGVIFALLSVAGTMASLLPALRAARISPAIALRYE